MKIVKVVAAIICQGNQILVTQRGTGEFKGGWEFPGGKIDPGETPEMALVREIQEELCLTIEPDSRLCTVEHDYPNFHLTMHCYLAHITSGKLQLTEHQAFRWLTKETLDTVQWLPADIEVVNALKQVL